MNEQEFKDQALLLTKARLGLTHTVRDQLLTANIAAIVDELQNEKGLSLNWDGPNHLMFVVDFATWRYQSVGEKALDAKNPMPRHLQYRLHNLILSSHRGDSNVNV